MYVVLIIPSDVSRLPYKTLQRNELILRINALAADKCPFLFVVDYDAAKGFVISENELDERYIRFVTPRKIFGDNAYPTQSFSWSLKPVEPEQYAEKFHFVQNEIGLGNSFLINLTQPTLVKTDLTLENLFHTGSAKYKLWLKDMFTVLSPEIFIQINDGIISSFPMKGTIDASLPNAAENILNDRKEMAEHATIVDLIRNDLSQIATDVEVVRYRFVEHLVTHKNDLLQVSSEIRGKLPRNFAATLGDSLFTLLPAGSICGAPKPKTLEIIAQAEGYKREFYTGVFGWFDGYNLDSAVMIRFAESHPEGLIFKSGGGVTSQSELLKEYEELIQKVYVPVI